MAAYYVYSAAAGAGTGADWANAYTTLTLAVAGKAAGDIFYIAHDHAESTAGAVTITSPGTSAAPCQFLCALRTGSVPPVSADLRTTATVATTGANHLVLTGSGYWYGVTFLSGSAANIAYITFHNGTNTNQTYAFDNCGFTLNNTGASFVFLSPSMLGYRQKVIFRSCIFTFGAVTQTFATGLDTEIIGGSIAGTIPTLLFTGYTSPGRLRMEGVDLSAAGSGKTLFFLGAATYVLRAEVDNCKLGSSVTIASFTNVAAPGHFVIRMTNGDSGDTNYRDYFGDYPGVVTTETTIVRTGGASDGTTTKSLKFVTTANSKFYSPLIFDSAPFWNETTGSSVTASVEVVTDNVTLTDAEAWIEVFYLGTSGFPRSLIANDRAADILATPANQTTSSETWTTTGLTTPVKQTLSIAFTPQEKGPYKVRVCLAKASTTMYADLKIKSTSSRQYMVGSAYVNEGVASGGGGGSQIIVG